MERGTNMDQEAYIRILQLKNNFYQDEGKGGHNPLGSYCVLGYFDAFDISNVQKVSTTEFNTWESLGKLTVDMDGTANCRMLVCVTERPEKDKVFWEEKSDALFLITMIKLNRAVGLTERLEEFMSEIFDKPKQIGYLSYDHSEIIVVTKTNMYSDGIARVNELRKNKGVVKTYTVFAVLETYLKSYKMIKDVLIDEKVFCRLHCMVKNEDDAETFRIALEKQVNARNEETIRVRKFRTLGANDWLMEINNVSICSILECYKTGNLLTHTNEQYNKAFYNIESEILVTGENDGCRMD